MQDASPPSQAWFQADAMASGYMLSAIPMSATAKLTVSSSGDFRREERFTAVARTAEFPRIVRMAEREEPAQPLISPGQHTCEMLIYTKDVKNAGR